MSRSGKIRFLLVVTALISLGALGSASAASANVANGSFETGTLEGWQVHESPGHQAHWAVLDAAEVEEAGGFTFPFPPPGGKYAAYSVEDEPGTTILYQDVALTPAVTNTLTLDFGYTSNGALVTPPDGSLDAEAVAPNQQVRVDVMKPTAPIESVAPGDILKTLYATQSGGPETVGLQKLSADLTPFAGQTVRLRVAVATTVGELNAGIDEVDVAVTVPAPLPAPVQPAPTPTPPSNKIVKGKLTLNEKNGTGTLAVTVPGAGTLTAIDASKKIAIATNTAFGVAARKAKPVLIKTAVLHPAAAGTVRVPFRPTAAARKLLLERGALAFRARLTFTPTGGTAATQVYKARLAKTLKARR